MPLSTICAVPTRSLRALTTLANGFVTLRHRATCEETIKRSRFVAVASPVSSAGAAQQVLAELSDPKATHNCFAYRLADGSSRSSGDGEPGGTAGPPILSAIEGAGLHEVLVLVQRFYGGVKLGTGGLARAYGGTAARCLRDAETHECARRIGCELRFVASDTAAVYATLARHGIMPPSPEEDGGDGVREGSFLRFDAPPEELESISRALQQATQGRVTPAERSHASDGVQYNGNGTDAG